MKKQTGSRRYPFRGITVDGLKHKASFLKRSIVGVVPGVEGGVEMVRVYPNGDVYLFRVLSMPLLPC